MMWDTKAEQSPSHLRWQPPLHKGAFDDSECKDLDLTIHYEMPLTENVGGRCGHRPVYVIVFGRIDFLMRLKIKKLFAAILALIILTSNFSVNSFAENKLDYFNFNSENKGEIPYYIDGNAYITELGELDASEGKSAVFTAPSNAENVRFTARVMSADTFILKLYDGDNFESVRITPDNENMAQLIAVADKGNLSVVYGNEQIECRSSSAISKITKAEIVNGIIDDASIGGQSFSAIPVNVHMYIDGENVKLGYIPFAPDGGSVDREAISVSWYVSHSADGPSTAYGTGMSVPKPEDNTYLSCSAAYGDLEISLAPHKTADLDRLVFETNIDIATGFNGSEQVGVTFKNGENQTVAPRVTDWTDYDELILRARSDNATGRVYQTVINSANGYFFTYFTADWAGSRYKDLVLNIGDESSLDVGGKPSWNDIKNVALSTSLTTRQAESGSLTKNEKDTYIYYKQAFIRKSKAKDKFSAKEFIPNANKTGNEYDFAESIISKNHPKIFLTDEKINSLKADIENDDYLKKSYELLQNDVRKAVIGGTLNWDEGDDGAIELAKAAMLYNLSPSDELKEWIDGSAAALVSSERTEWNHNNGSFLWVGETTRYMALVYDWMYNHWTEAQRLAVRNGIMRCGILPVLPTLRAEARWAGAGYGNWNQAVLSGAGMGMLAICDSGNYAELTNEILTRVTNSLGYGLRDFDENGAHTEGVAYWHYAMDTFIPFEAALSYICGTDAGLMDSEKMEKTGYFPIMMMGKQNFFTFADAYYPSNIRTAAFFRLSERYNNPLFAAFQYNQSDLAGGGDFLSMLLYNGETDGAYHDYLPSYRYYPGLTESFAVNGGKDVGDAYLAFKGGQNGISHSQLDIGTFVYDSQNVRWICDLGRDSYNDYGNKTKYYRNRAEGNNCIVINPDTGADQNLTAKGSITAYEIGSKGAYGIIDMSAAYEDAKKVERGFMMCDNYKTLVIQDEIASDSTLSEVYSFFHTEQSVELGADGTSAVITPKDGRDRRVYVKLLSSCNATLSVMDVTLLKTQAAADQFSNSAYKKLAVKAENAKELTFTLIISDIQTPSINSIIPLKDWGASIKFGRIIKIDGKAYDGVSRLSEGRHTITSQYADNTLIKKPDVYISHIRDNTPVSVNYGSGMAELTGSFADGDMLKVFIWTDYIKPLITAETIE